MPGDDLRGAADRVFGLIVPGAAAVAVPHGPVHQLVVQRRNGFLRHLPHPFRRDRRVALLPPGQPGKPVQRRVIKIARFDGVYLPFPKHLRPKPIVQEMLEGASRKLLQPADGQRFPAVQRPGRLRGDGLRAAVVTQGAQQPQRGRRGLLAPQQLPQLFRHVRGQLAAAISVQMGPQLHAQLRQRLHRRLRQTFLRLRGLGQRR